jgi:hypothetical protein
LVGWGCFKFKKYPARGGKAEGKGAEAIKNQNGQQKKR